MNTKILKRALEIFQSDCHCDFCHSGNGCHMWEVRRIKGDKACFDRFKTEYLRKATVEIKAKGK